MSMKAKWLIETECFGDPPTRDNARRIAQLAKERGHETFILPNNVKFSDLPRVMAKCPFTKDDCVITYGSLELVKYQQSPRGVPWIPGDWCDFNKLRATTYMAHWGIFSIHRTYGFYPYAEVIRHFDRLLYGYADPDVKLDERAIFIRSDSNDKIIGGAGLVTSATFDKWRHNVEAYSPSPETLVMVSRPSTIEQEWRFVIADGKVITGSRYRYFDDVHLERMGDDVSLKAAAFAEMVLKNAPWTPSSMFCMDVALTTNKQSMDGFKIVECGSVNVCGLYDCDVEVVFNKASEIAEKEHSEIFA